MAKQKNGQQQSPRRLEPVQPGGVRRLEGDALFTWATFQSEVRQLQQQMMGFIQMQAQELGFDPQRETIDGAGYIRPIQQQPSPIQMGEGMVQAPPESAPLTNGV